MYQSPIEIIHGELEMQLEGEVYKAVQRVGVNVNKEELLKALQYDRGQYLNGYGDGYEKAIEEFAERIRDWQKEIYQNGKYAGELDFLFKHINEIAEQLKGE